MIVAYPLHIVAIIAWLGGLCMLFAVAGPESRGLDPAASVSLWQRLLARFFAWGVPLLVMVLVTGIVIGPVRFGGFSDAPVVHQWNTPIGLMAIALFAYAWRGPYRAIRRAVAESDWPRAQRRVARTRTVLGAVLVLGLVSSVVSSAGRMAAGGAF